MRSFLFTEEKGKVDEREFLDLACRCGTGHETHFQDIALRVSTGPPRPAGRRSGPDLDLAFTLLRDEIGELDHIQSVRESLEVTQLSLVARSLTSAAPARHAASRPPRTKGIEHRHWIDL